MVVSAVVHPLPRDERREYVAIRGGSPLVHEARHPWRDAWSFPLGRRPVGFAGGRPVPRQLHGLRHDMPIVVTPARDNQARKRPLLAPVVQPLGPEPGQWYWMEYAQAMGMAAEMRLGEGSVLLRYDDVHDHLTAFSARFAGRLEGLNLYAMAARQVNPLTEYLCHWRVVEWADGTNGKAFVEGRVGDVASYDFVECLASEVSATMT